MSLRSFIQSFFRRLRDFGRDEAGMTLPLLAMSMVMITGMVGVAIDTARAQLVQSKLQFSLDAAGLAAGSTVSTSNLTTEVNKYLTANFNGYLGANVTNVTATSDVTNTIITLGATATLPTTFMNALNVPTMTVSANSKVTRSVTGLELVLVLDNTGSMANSAGGSTSKIQALQTAANTLVNTLFNGQATAPKNLYVGIVPFSQAVNIGTSRTGWLNTTTFNWGPTKWGGCVDARWQSGEDTTDDPPGTGNTLFQQYYWPTDNNNCWEKTKVNGTRVCSSTGTSPQYSSPLNTTSIGPNLYCPQQVTPMTTDKATLTTSINAMVAEGNTEINQGLQWGWFMLSPRWQGLWGGTMGANGLPLAYNTKGMNKAVVLLTDGENTIDNSSRGSYWYLNDNHLGTTSSSGGVTALNNRTLQLCTAMKNAGIYIYTIALGTDVTPDSLALLSSCATASNYAFVSPSTTQLQTIFSAIGDSLSNLRVSQ